MRSLLTMALLTLTLLSAGCAHYGHKGSCACGKSAEAQKCACGHEGACKEGECPAEAKK